MKKILALASTVVVLSAGGGATAWAAAGDSPAPRTITHVAGDADHGFTIERYDGSTTYTPTDSEARAECEEYGHRVARVRCRTHVRQLYRDLRRIKNSMAYERSR